MIREQYVSYETARLLKGKGFNEPCIRYYYGNGIMAPSPSFVLNSECLGDTEHFIAPTQSLVMRWLREVHNLAIIIKPFWTQGDMRNKIIWTYEITSLSNTEDWAATIGEDSYEESCEAAIKYCLEKPDLEIDTIILKESSMKHFVTIEKADTQSHCDAEEPSRPCDTCGHWYANHCTVNGHCDRYVDYFTKKYPET